MTPGKGRNWLKPRSRSLEDFLLFLVKLALRVALVIFAVRYAVNADPANPPWVDLLGLP